jgi:hypothetical protein
VERGRGEKEKCKQKEKYFSVKLVSITNTPKKSKTFAFEGNIFKGNVLWGGRGERGECAVMASIVTCCFVEARSRDALTSLP